MAFNSGNIFGKALWRWAMAMVAQISVVWVQLRIEVMVGLEWWCVG